MLEQLRKLVALWKFFEKAPKGWRNSVIDLIYYAIVIECGAKIPGPCAFCSINKKEEIFFKLVGQAFQQLPAETRQKFIQIFDQSKF